ncbi:MAG: nucleoside deaminase [Filifactoraceae bacterium]
MDIFMREAFREALLGYKENEIPVGAVVVKDNKVIGRGHNIIEQSNMASRHAEIIAIEEAGRFLGSWRLVGCSLYVTLEPCTMCMGAIINSRIRDLHIGTLDAKTGAAVSVLKIVEEELIPNRVVATLHNERVCEYVLKRFFRKLRKRDELNRLK